MSTKTHPRISREDLFMEIAHMTGERSTCPRAQVGCVATREGRLIAMGYNGAPAKMPHCLDVGCQIVVERREDIDDPNLELVQHCVRSVHAEANLIAWSARTGTVLAHAELYTTHGLCTNCAKLCINAGIEVVRYCKEYDMSGVGLLKEAGIRVFHQESC